MSRWFRHYAGMVRDAKLVSASIASKQPIERVVWVWGAILESAAEVDDGGRFNVLWDADAYYLRVDESALTDIVAALSHQGMIADGVVCDWHGFDRRCTRLPWSEWAVLRLGIFQRDDFTCRYCGAHGVPLECDHATPLSRGGTNDRPNLVTACRACNRSKGSMTADEFRQSRV